MSSIPLPKTLAAVCLKSEILSENGARLVATVLQSELPVSAVPMENYLERGGWPEFVGIDMRGVRDQTHQIELLLTLRFIEHTPASCPSSSKPETRIAYIRALIDKATGVAELVDDS
jgi:hypothetical protein